MIGNIRETARVNAENKKREKIQRCKEYITKVRYTLKNTENAKNIKVGEISLQKYLSQMKVINYYEANINSIPPFFPFKTIPNVIRDLGAQELVSKFENYTFSKTPNSRDVFFGIYKLVDMTKESHIPYIGLKILSRKLNGIINDDNLVQCETVDKIRKNKERLERQVGKIHAIRYEDIYVNTISSLHLGFKYVKHYTMDQMRKDNEEPTNKPADSYHRASQEMLDKLSLNMEELGNEYRMQYFERFKLKK